MKTLARFTLQAVLSMMVKALLRLPNWRCRKRFRRCAADFNPLDHSALAPLGFTWISSTNNHSPPCVA